MSILDDVKSVGQLVQQYGNMELHEKIMDLRGEVMELVEENRELKKEVESLKEKLQVKESLKFENNVYWKEIPGGREGPFCSKCWDADKLLVHMLITSDPRYAECPKCQAPVQVGA